MPARIDGSPHIINIDSEQVAITANFDPWGVAEKEEKKKEKKKEKRKKKEGFSNLENRVRNYILFF